MPADLSLMIVAAAVALWSVALVVVCVNSDTSARTAALRQLATSLAVLLALRDRGASRSEAAEPSFDLSL